MVFVSGASKTLQAPVQPLAAVPGEANTDASWRGIDIAICDLDAIEQEWRQFEQSAECTPFQSFDWLSLWHRHVGVPGNVRAAVVVGRSRGKLEFLLPLAVTPGLVRRLTFLGEGLCDYNVALIAPDFLARLSRADFLSLWRHVRELLQRQPQLRHDIVELTRMPEALGPQPNPFLHLPTSLNPSGAHWTELSGTWDEFYMAKRSSATRRRDRTKVKRLAEHGEIRFVDPTNVDDIQRTVETLMEQKTKAFARMGVKNLFARPGHREFFLDLATNPRARSLAHVSRLDVGATCAAANLGLTFRGTYYHVLASYEDGELARFGPGAAHLRELIGRAIARGLRRFDFTIGDERYKLEWSDTSVRLHDHVAAATPRGWPVVLVSFALRRLKRLVKQNPVLWRVFNSVRAAAATGRGEPKGADSAESSDSPPIAPR